MIADGQEIEARRVVGRDEDGQLGLDRPLGHPEPGRAVDAELGLVRCLVIVQGVIGRREPFPGVDVIQIERLGWDLAGDGVGPVGRDPVLLRIHAGRGVQASVGHRDEMPEDIRHRVVVGPGRERGEHPQGPAVVGELGIRLGRPGRDLAVADRVDFLASTIGRMPPGPRDRQVAIDQVDRLLLVAHEADQEADPGRPSGCNRQIQEQGGDGVEGRVGVGVLVVGEGEGFEGSGVPEAPGPADEVHSRGQEAFGGRVGRQDAHRLGVLVPGEHGVEALGILHLGEQAVVLGVPPVGVGLVEDPLQVRHDLDAPGRIRRVLDRDFPDFRRVARACGPDLDRGLEVVPFGNDPQAILAALEAGSLGPAAREVADDRPGRLIARRLDQEQGPAGGVEEVVGASGDVVAPGRRADLAGRGERHFILRAGDRPACRRLRSGSSSDPSDEPEKGRARDDRANGQEHLLEDRQGEGRGDQAGAGLVPEGLGARPRRPSQSSPRGM